MIKEGVIVDNLNRREFLKGCTVAGMVAILPAIFLVEEEVWDIRLDERDFRKAISLGGITWEGKDAFIEAHLDTLKMWQAVVMTDPRGGEWRTIDGKVWSDGKDSFEMPVMEG